MKVFFGLIFFLSVNVLAESEQKPFVVVIPSYNNEQWCQKNLESVFLQNYQNYRVIYIDDCSTDNTYDLAKALITHYNQWHRTTLIRNEQRRGALANLYNAIHSCADEEIIVTVDGDDWLAHDHVLERLNQEYQNKNVWLTYGQYRQTDGNMGCCRPIYQYVIAQNTYRQDAWVSSHLRTFYAWLFKCIKVEDLRYQNDFFPVAWDQAFMLPMLEMSGGRFRCISDVLYIYNVGNPISDFRVNLHLQYLVNVIRNMKPYNSLQ